MRQSRELPSPALVWPDEAQSGTSHHTHLTRGFSGGGPVAVGSGPEGLGDDGGLGKAACRGQREGEPGSSVPPAPILTSLDSCICWGPNQPQ